MPLSSSTQLEMKFSGLMTRVIGASNMESRCDLGGDGIFRFTDGAGALQGTAIVDASIACNNVAVPCSVFSRIDGNAFGSLTKLKAAVFHNPSTNAEVILTSSVSGVCVGTIKPGGVMAWISPDAGGLTVSGASTFTANGGGGTQYLRVILLLA